MRRIREQTPTALHKSQRRLFVGACDLYVEHNSVCSCGRANVLFKILSELREKLPGLEVRLERLQNSLTNVARFIDKAKRYIDLTELTPEILRLFVEKIVIGEKAQKYSHTAE